MIFCLKTDPSSDQSKVWAHLGPLIRIGRAQHCELCLLDASVVSSQHAQIELRADGPWLADCNSTNGTFLNDNRLTTLTLLKVGDRINLGQRGPELRVDVLEAGPQALAEPILGGSDIVRRIQHAKAQRAAAASTEPAMSRWLMAAIVLAALTPLALIGFTVLESARRPDNEPVVAHSVGTQKTAPVDPTIVPRTTATVQGTSNVTPPHQSREEPAPAESDPSTSNEGTGHAEQETPVPTPPAPPPKVAESAASHDEKIAATKMLQPSTGGDTGKLTLFEQANAVLKQHCYRCHGQQGSNEGGFNVVLNRSRLVLRQYIKPGNAKDSFLFQRVRDGEMPPEGKATPPNEIEIASLKAWIDAGAPDAGLPKRREFINTEQAIQIVADDLRGINERERRFIRYFTLTHLYNAGAADDELQTYRNALSKLVNSLSWKRQIVQPTPIDEAQTILRIDLRDYEWTDQVWNAILALNPYGIVYDSPVARQCYRDTQTEIPFVRADWFVFKASRPPLYERVLRIPDTDRDMEKMLMVDVAQNIRQETVKRAGFNSSGVSQNNRLIERHESTYGAYWRSYDFAGNTALQNLFDNPLGPEEVLPLFQRRRAFKPAGGELIFSLPNGLQGYMLVNGTGRRIERGPTEIVSDPKQSDRAVVNGISCMSCHYAGIIKKSDEIRQHVIQNRDAFGEANDILALYAPKEAMDRLMEEDARRFRQAVEKTGSTVSENGEPVVNISRRFEEDLDLTMAAAEVGMGPQEFSDRLDKLTQLRRALGQLLVSGGTVKRQVLNESFGDLARQLRLGRVALRRPN